MPNEARKNSVEQLARLYSVVIGIALTLAMRSSLTPDASWPLVRLDCALNLASFFILVIPFYHGAMRHLYATYVEGGGSTRVKNGALFVDFILLFLEGCAFVVMSSVISDVSKFAWMVVFVLVLDSVWGVLASLAFTGAQAQNSERIWALINLVASVALICMLLLVPSRFVSNLIQGQFVLLSILTLRTVIDYIFCWQFYFPSIAEPT
jgi:hypothetical protein